MGALKSEKTCCESALSDAPVVYKTWPLGCPFSVPVTPTSWARKWQVFIRINGIGQTGSFFSVQNINWSVGSGFCGLTWWFYIFCNLNWLVWLFTDRIEVLLSIIFADLRPRKTFQLLNLSIYLKVWLLWLFLWAHFWIKLKSRLPWSLGLSCQYTNCS